MEPVIELINVSVAFGGREALADINVALGPRSLHVVFGPNGAGKTTLVKVIAGMIKPDRGEVRIFGKAAEKAATKIGYVPQRGLPRRDFPVNVLDVVLMGRYGRVGLFKKPGRKDREKALGALRTVGLEMCADSGLRELSGGQMQRMMIARALAGEPDVLLLDEAESGVDAGAKESLYELLIRLKETMTIIFVTHDMSVVSTEVDTVSCLNKKLVSHGDPGDALTDTALRCMYGAEVAAFSHCGQPHVHVKGHPK